VFIQAKDDGGGGDNWSYKSCKAPVKSSPPINQHPFFKGWMPFLLPNQQCQSTEGKISHSVYNCMSEIPTTNNCDDSNIFPGICCHIAAATGEL